jgi:hypothetical protein
MNASDILLIGIVAGFVCFAILSIMYVLLVVLRDNDDFEDVRFPETFNLPIILNEIEEKEKAATDVQDQ